MPSTPAPYVRRPYAGEGLIRLADLGLQMARMQSNNVRDLGQQSAQRWSTAGNAIGQGLGAIREEKALVPLREAAKAKLAHDAELMRREDEQYAEGRTAQANDKAKSAKLRQLSEQYQGQRIPTDVLVKAFGPDDAAHLDKAFDELYPKPKPAEPYTLNQGDQRRGLNNELVAENPKPAPVNTPPSIGSFEDYVTTKFGARPTPAQIESARQAYGRADDRPTPTAATVPGNWDVEGNAFLKSIPAQWRKTVEKIAKYDEDPTKVASMRGGNREMLMQWVNQVNPAYDASQFSLRAPTRKAFTIGTQGQQINAINTAMGHLDQLTEVADQLQTGGLVPGNQAWNAIRTAFGSNKVTNFDTLKDALAGEVAGVLSKGGATVSGIQDAKSHITAANSPAQLAGYVKTLIPVMGSKLSAFDYQYKQAMGDNDSFSPLSEEAKRILLKHGFDPAHPTIAQSAAPKVTGEVWESDGKGGFRPKKP